MLQTIRRFKIKKAEKISPFYQVGFHGDKYLEEVVSYCLKKTEQFIETGANVGSTLVWVLKNNPGLNAYSCEPNLPAYKFTKKKLKPYPNAEIMNCGSSEMFNLIKIQAPMALALDTVFWLDAHENNYTWPLKQEISFITNNFPSAYIFIDDFEVPGRDDFKFGEYEGQKCNLEYIQEAIKPGLKFNKFYPSYRDRTSTHHPLVGWGLIEFGHSDSSFPEKLSEKVIKYA